MSFVIILIVLAAQYYLRFYSAPYQMHWVGPYFQWLQTRFEALTKGHGLFGVFLFVVPLLIVVSLVFTIVYHLLGYVGYLLLSLVLMWYCCDIQSLHEKPAASSSINALFLASYQTCFALLFWYFVFGPVGLALYVVVSGLHAYLKPQSDTFPDLSKYSALTLGILDWIPVRLLGLSFALVGHFGAVFKNWIAALAQGVTLDQQYILDWGYAALSLDEKAEKQAEAYSEVRLLLVRSLCVWLVVMALLSLGYWAG